MNTKMIAITIVFAALTIALNLSPIKIPAPYLPFLIYQIWEIPIVAAFLLCGVKSGVSISIINTAMLFVVFPGLLPTGPLYNFAAVLSMLLGIYIAHSSLVRGRSQRRLETRTDFNWQRGTTLAAFSTVVGIIFRVGMMSIINYTLLRYPPPIGYALPEAAIVAMLPLVGFFNATLALYTIPTGHFLAKAVSLTTKITR